MDEKSFLKLTRDLAARGIPEHQYNYFREHQTRLTKTLSLLDLWNLKNSRVLEIGPFYAFTPFLYREHGNEVTVLEGTDPVIAPLRPLYEERGIRCDQMDLQKVLTQPSDPKRRLPYDEASFDSVVCFETMEHFNFNPVVFVRELQRVLAPGGTAYITVPNQAKLRKRIDLFFGRPISTPIPSYYDFADYNNGEFLGFHWREYLLQEVVELFSRGGFHIERAQHLQTFMDLSGIGLRTKLERAIGRVLIKLFPATAQNCVVIVRRKP
jgi:SAM-dependent methyltransferase